MENTSQVDFNKDLSSQRFPLVAKAKLLDVTLQPGEMYVSLLVIAAQRSLRI